jgi:ABC-2 type transport system ATP-binding protein
MNSNIAICASGLTKSFGNIIAVDHIDFEVERGEIFGFLGPNGAGKTTTIRMLTGLSRPTEGKGSILGLDIDSEIVKIKRRIGVVPEISNLYDELTAYENLIFMAQLYGITRVRRRERAEELLKIFGLYERKDTLFRTFSRGMKRALTIAAALIHNPEILFLDEPTVGLDVVAARSLRNLIGNLNKKGMTVFLTTHYLEEADILCDRVAILIKGSIVRVGSPGALKSAVEEESVIEILFDGELMGLEKELSSSLPEVRIMSFDRNKLRIYGGEPATIYDTLVSFAKNKNIRIRSINSIKPTLEDAFIKITGMSPAIMAIEKGGR